MPVHHRKEIMNNDLTTLSDHVLNWLINEEEISQELRENIEKELLARKEPDEIITLTSKMLHDASTCGYHGFTAAQAAVFGFKWPLKRGWLKSLVGKRVPMRKYRAFVEAAKLKK